MNDANYLALRGKIKELERRIEKLETSRSISELNGEADRLLEVYPFMMDKIEAAKVLGVSRCTIYLMVKDGRLEVNPVGRIPTRSVIDYIKKGRAVRD